MAYYKPCTNCAVDRSECAIRGRIKGAISGLHITSVNFVCNERKEMFDKGQRVAFRWRVFGEPDYYGQCDEDVAVFHATVLYESGLRFVVRVDDGQSVECKGDPAQAKDTFRNDSLIIKVRPADMWSIDEGKRVICASCAAYPGEKDRCQSWDGYTQEGCLRPITAA